MSKNKNQNYIDKDEFTQAVIEYAEEYRDAESSGDDPPRMSNYIGRCILSIAENLSTRANFSGYSYREDMICDAIEDVVKYLKNFDPEKANGKPNAFGYVSQIMWFAFLRRLKKEEKQQDIQQNMIENAGILDEIMNTQDHDNRIYTNDYLASIQSAAGEYYTMFEGMNEDKKEKPKTVKSPRKTKKTKPSGLEEFMG